LTKLKYSILTKIGQSLKINLQQLDMMVTLQL